MENSRRHRLLKILAFGAFGLLALDWLFITPFLKDWSDRSERMTILKSKIEKGRSLLSREKVIRDRWKEMNQKDLDADYSLGEGSVLAALNQWRSSAGVEFNSMTPRHKSKDANSDTCEVTVTLSGNQTSLARFLYEMESDPLPIKLENCEIEAQDEKGRQLNMTTRFTALRLLPEAKKQEVKLR